jgi:glycosyltransferase involved in cell wall biosynthesis
MRICLVSQEYPPETARGGIGSQTYLKAHGLRARGHEVCVLSASTDQRRHDRRDDGVRVVRIAGFHDRMAIYTEPARWLAYSTEVAATLAALHSETPIDLVEFPEWGGEGYVHLLNQTEWNHIPSVVHIHGPLVMLAHTIGWPDVHSELYRVGTAMEATSVRLADRVFSSSRCSAGWCAEHYDLDLGQIPVLHAGVDRQLFSPRDVPKDERPTVVSVGRLAENKGVCTLVEACCGLAKRYPDLRLRLIGRSEGSLAERLRQRALAAGLPELLDIVGFVDRRELPEHLSRAHLLAVPSAYEGGPGFVYLEAMACGLPVIACEGSGAAEVIRPGDNGLLVPPNDVTALAAALDPILSDAGRRQAMATNALRYVRAEADSEVCTGRIEELYRDVVAAGRTTRR